MCLAVGVVMLPLYGVAPFLPRGKVAWIYGIVLLAMGLTSCCFIAFSIPLFIFWLKPETRAYFESAEPA